MICTSCRGESKFWLRIFGCSECSGQHIVRPYNVDEILELYDHLFTNDNLVIQLDDERDVATLEKAGYKFHTAGHVGMFGTLLTFKKPKKNVRMNKNV